MIQKHLTAAEAVALDSRLTKNDANNLRNNLTRWRKTHTTEAATYDAGMKLKKENALPPLPPLPPPPPPPVGGVTPPPPPASPSASPVRNPNPPPNPTTKTGNSTHHLRGLEITHYHLAALLIQSLSQLHRSSSKQIFPSLPH